MQSKMPQADNAMRDNQDQNPYWPPVPRAYGAPYSGTYGSTTSPPTYAPYRPDYSYATRGGSASPSTSSAPVPSSTT